jgi:ATP-dependent exoDNAse (exonuclease V) alpha subunit
LGDTQTVAEFLQKQSLPSGAVVIVDEAGQIGGKQMLALLEYIQSRKGRVILSGDTRQHGPVEASDALRAIERYANLHPAELSEVRRQDPARGADAHERMQISRYRGAVQMAAIGQLSESFDILDRLGCISEIDAASLDEQLASAYLQLAVQKESAIIVSQTWSKIHEINAEIRRRLCEQSLISANETMVTALEKIDLTPAQKKEDRFYPGDAMISLNRPIAGYPPGSVANKISIGPYGLVLEIEGKIALVKPDRLDSISVFKPRPMPISAGDRLQLKANGKSTNDKKLANGEVVSVAKVKPNGEILLTDGRILPASYRQFVHGYAVTSYGSQGKTMDHILFADSSVKPATSDQQWYVTISRGRKSIRIFTSDKEQLRENAQHSGDRSLALELDEGIKVKLRKELLPGVHRGRALAKAISMRVAAALRLPWKPKYLKHITP